MISNYVRPQLEIFNQIQNTNATTGTQWQALAIGPNYRLNRYGLDTIPTGAAFAAAGATLDLEYVDATGATDLLPTTDVVDQTLLALYGIGLELTLAAYTGSTSTKFYLASLSTPQILTTAALQITTGTIVAASGVTTNGTLAVVVTGAGLTGSPVTVNVALTTATTTASGIATLVRAALNANGPITAAYTVGGTGAAITLTGTNVNDGTLNLAWSGMSADGIADLTTSTATQAGEDFIIAGAGLVASLYTRSTQIGDIVYITDPTSSVVRRRTVVGLASSTNSTTAFDQIVLNGPAVDVAPLTNTLSALVVTIRLSYSGIIASSQYTFSAGPPASVAYQAAVTIPVLTRSGGNQNVAAADGVGLIYPSYRSLIPPVTNQAPIACSDAADIEDNFGKIDLQNDLAYGLQCMLNGSQGRTVYGMPTTGFQAADFAPAFAAISATNQYGFIALLSHVPAVLTAAAAHARAMAAPDVRNYRKFYTGTDSPGVYVVLQYHVDGTTPFTATIGGSSGNRLIQFSDGALDLETLNLSYGDSLAIGGSTYVINAVLSSQELTLVGGPATNASPQSVIISRANTVASQKAYLENLNSGLNCELLCNIWVENGTTTINGVATVIPNKYIACEIAGLRSALLPQQGLTMTQISTITAAPSMYLRYTQTDLNAIASFGTYIVTQESSNGPVFIRHQLTTNSSAGELFSEDTGLIIINDIDFQMQEALGPGYLGKTNATPTTVTQIDNAAYNVLLAATGVTNPVAGPEIIAFSGLTAALDKVLKDRINVGYTITVPLPLNNIVVTQTAVITTAT